MRLVIPEPLTAAAWAPFGAVVQAGEGRLANEGTAMRIDFAVELENRRAAARLNVSVFRCEGARRDALPIRLLERHPHSTQLFSPIGPARVVVVVAPGGADGPELAGLRAFLPGPRQGVAYHPGTWHHPMIAVELSDLLCLVHEDGSAADCEVVRFDPPPVAISLR
jgi:ureidoglycolate lyase